MASSAMRSSSFSRERCSIRTGVRAAARLVLQQPIGSSGRSAARVPPAASASASTSATVDALLEATAGTQRGVATTPEAREKIMRLVADLKSAGAGSRTVDAASGTWELLWTTEKETLFIIKNCWLFGTKAGGVFQVVDVGKGRLQNVITFPPDGAFIVDSSISVEGDQRISFQFDAAKLKLPSRDVGVPPFGQGWFNTVYVDDRVRVAEDVRGDTLVVRRDGPPRVFS